MNNPAHESVPDQPPRCSLSLKKVSRRRFIDWIIKGGLLATLAGFLAPALAYLWPVTRSGPGVGPREAGRVDDIPMGGSQKVTLGGSALILLRTSKGVKAFSAICTHLGCILDWHDQKHEFICPCHAAVFDADGRVVSGPPPRPLPSYEVRVVDGKIYVTL